MTTRETLQGRDGEQHSLTRCTVCGIILHCVQCGDVEPASAANPELCQGCGDHGV